MTVQVSILVENTTPTPSFVGEYGFAAMVDIDGKRYLFDTGCSGALFPNAASLGLNLTDIEGVIISHGHFDHTGALLPVIEKSNNKKIYAHSNIFAHRPVQLGNGQYREIGCACNREELEKAGAELIFTDVFTAIAPSIFVTGEVPRITAYEDVGARFQIEKDGQFFDDALIDDMAMVIDRPEGLIIISGCAHSGIINIMDYVCKKIGKDHIQAFIGGTHLIGASDNRMVKTIEALRNISIDRLIVSHCTGFHAAAKLYNAMPDKVIKGDAGMVFTF